LGGGVSFTPGRCTCLGPAWVRLSSWLGPGCSVAAATPAAVGLLLWAVQWWRPRIVDHAAAVGLGCLGGIVAAAGVLAALFPPSLTKGTLVPWLEACAGLAAAAAAIRAARAGRSSG